MTRLPVPVVPPTIVSTFVPELLVSVVAVLFTFSTPEIVNADVVLLSVRPLTLEPTGAVMDVVPVPAPVFVTVPALLTELVVKLIPPVVPLLAIVRLFEPVTPPLKVVEIAVPEVPTV